MRVRRETGTLIGEAARRRGTVVRITPPQPRAALNDAIEDP